MTRRIPIPLVLALLAVAGGCAREPEPPAPDLDLSGPDAEAWFAFDSPAAQPRVLWRGTDLERADWQRAVRLAVDPSAEEVAAFEAGTRVAQGGVVEMSAPRGALLHLIPLDDGVEWLEVSGAITAAGLTGRLEDGYARLGVFQLSTSTWPGSARALVPHVLSDHFGDPLIENTAGPRPVSIRLHRHPDAVALGLVVDFLDERAAGEASAAFAALRVTALGAATRTLEVAEAVLDPPGPEERARRARFAVDLVHRFGYALPAHARLELPVEVDASGRRIELYAAALGADRDARWTVRCTWSSGGRDVPLVAEDLTLVDDGDPATAPTGWRRIVASLPADAAGGGALTIAVEGDGRSDAATPTVPVIASARLVGDGGPPRPNVLLVSLDTVRADHLGAYGGDPRLSSSFDRVAAEGALFARTWSTSPYTLPAHLSLFSGQHPSVHGVQRPSQRRDRMRTPMLAELLSAAGYRTAAFTGGAMVLPTFGFASGFERYGVLDPWINEESPRIQALLAGLAGVGPRAHAATGMAAIEAELDSFGDAPWFLFAHTYSAHEFDPPQRHLEAIDAGEGRPSTDPDILRYIATPTTPPEELRQRLAELYAAGVRHADEFLGALVELVERRGELDETVIVVVSDHGKELAEHGLVAHGHALYEELVAVPLAIRAPGVRARVDRSPAQLVDVLPTLVGLLDLELPPGIQGRDLLAPGAVDDDRPQWAEIDVLVTQRALREGSTKFIEDLRDAGASARFDLDRDPDERAPLPLDAVGVERLLEYGAALERVRAALPAEALAAAELDADDVAQLRALGYLVDEEGAVLERD